MFDAASATPAPNVEVVSHGSLTWAYVERPTLAETDYLHRVYGLRSAHLAGCLSRRRQPKLVEQDSYLFLTLSFPTHNALARSVSSTELDVFVGDSYLLTLHRGEARLLARLFRDCQSDQVRRAQLMRGGSGHLLYVILDLAVAQSLQALDALAGGVRQAEEALLREDDQDLVREIVLLRRELAGLARLHRAQRGALVELAACKRWASASDDDLPARWGSLVDRMDYALGVVEECRETLDGLGVASHLLMIRRTSTAVRLLAVAFVSLLPLAALAAFLGSAASATSLEGFAFPLGVVVLVTVVAGAVYLLRRHCLL